MPGDQLSQELKSPWSDVGVLRRGEDHRFHGTNQSVRRVQNRLNMWKTEQPSRASYKPQICMECKTSTRSPIRSVRSRRLCPFLLPARVAVCIRRPRLARLLSSLTDRQNVLLAVETIRPCCKRFQRVNSMATSVCDITCQCLS